MLFGKAVEPNSATNHHNTNDAFEDICVVTNEIYPLDGECCEMNHTKRERNGKKPHVCRIKQKGNKGFSSRAECEIRGIDDGLNRGADGNCNDKG